MDQDATDPTRPADIRDEAQRLAADADRERLPLRLMGGLAIWVQAPSVRRPPYERPYGDLDFVAASGARKRIVAFFEERGYVGERLFNALHGATRLNFTASHGRWTVDVIFDALDMSHRIVLRDRLALPGPTLDLADLLLTKLQVWEINRKDLGDAGCLLADHALGGEGEATIDLTRIRGLTSGDWGLCHTVLRNLQRVATQWQAEPVSATPFDPIAQAATLREEIERAPKSLAWKARARVGERVRWYETPEEVRHEAEPGGPAPAA